LRLIVALLACVFAAIATPVLYGQSERTKPGPALAAAGQNSPADSAMEYLLTVSAQDFHDHRPPEVKRFRNVHLGHMTTSAGTNYLVCGEFLPKKQEGKAEWTQFATIKTSGYEQWLGAQAAGMCKPSQFVRDNDKDLSFALQTRLDSLR